jgi:membrane associated rhomboid family serine protease
MRMPWRIKYNYEVIRLFVPTFMHFGFSHLIISLLLQLITGSVVESVIGPVKTLILYLLTAIGANLLGAVSSSAYAIGSEPFTYAMLGSFFGMLLMYWNRMGEDFCPKICAVFMLIIGVVIVTMLVTISATTYTKTLRLVYIVFPDVWGCVGGFVVGLFSSLWMLPKTEQGGKPTSRERGLMIAGIICTVVYFVVLVVWLAAVVEPKAHWNIV